MTPVEVPFAAFMLAQPDHSARPADIWQALPSQLALDADDRERDATGYQLWQHRIATLVAQLRERGVLAPHRRGEPRRWTLTPAAGVAWATALTAKAAATAGATGPGGGAAGGPAPVAPPTPPPADLPAISAIEGAGRLRVHRGRERDRRLRRAKVRQVLARDGTLRCECCDRSGADLYGPLGAALVDIHHRDPLASGERLTTLDDLAVCCPWCHRALHRLIRQGQPAMIDDLRSLIASQRPPAVA